MSQDDQALIIGRVVMEHNAAQKHFLLLRERARENRALFQRMADLIASRVPDVNPLRSTAVDLVPDTEMPTVREIMQLLNEVDIAEKHLKDLAQRKKDLEA